MTWDYLDLDVFILKFYFTFSAFRGEKNGQESGAVSGKRNRKVLRAHSQGREVLRGGGCVCVCVCVCVCIVSFIYFFYFIYLFFFWKWCSQYFAHLYFPIRCGSFLFWPVRSCPRTPHILLYPTSLLRMQKSSSGERKRLVQVLIVFSLKVNYVHQSQRDKKYKSYCWQGSG